MIPFSRKQSLQLMNYPAGLLAIIFLIQTDLLRSYLQHTGGCVPSLEGCFIMEASRWLPRPLAGCFLFITFLLWLLPLKIIHPVGFLDLAHLTGSFF